MLKNADNDDEDERNVMIIQMLYMSILATWATNKKLTVISYLDLVSQKMAIHCFLCTDCVLYIKLMHNTRLDTMML